MKILFCGYRKWSHDILNQLRKQTKHTFDLAIGPSELTAQKASQYDVILVVGWSWLIEKEIVENNYVIGMHPSKLPDYAGGSPIQHQIIDGLEYSHVTLFKLTPNFDDGMLISMYEYSLQGHLNDVLKNISIATFELIQLFLTNYPNIILVPQGHKGIKKRRLKPEQSQLSKLQFQELTCKELWNHIRCREDPYPNVFIKDETGKLIISVVEFEPL